MISQVVNLKPDVIFAVGTRLVVIPKRATTTIPVVGLMAGPIRMALSRALRGPAATSPALPTILELNTTTIVTRY
jgi:hypothetical protein